MFVCLFIYFVEDLVIKSIALKDCENTRISSKDLENTRILSNNRENYTHFIR